jgi:hypothetical protein
MLNYQRVLRWYKYQWIGLFGKIYTGNQSYFPMEYGVFRFPVKFPLNQSIESMSKLMNVRKT